MRCLIQLQSQSSALDQISANIGAVAKQVKAFIGENKQTLKPALEKLNGVLTIVDNRKGQVQESIKRLNAYAMSLGESVSSGPFFKAYLANLLPGQFVQPFIDAAFSDLGLDPNTLAPSQRTDPQVGQPGTPALPVPYPRTGSGWRTSTQPARRHHGQAGRPGLRPARPAAARPNRRYPYREPLPAPPPGGPPPGPPALPLVPGAGAETGSHSPPAPLYVPAPGEVPPTATHHRQRQEARDESSRWKTACSPPYSGHLLGRQRPSYSSAPRAASRGSTSPRTSPTATGCTSATKIRILGIPVGKIDRIEPQPGQAKISFWVDDEYKVPADVNAGDHLTVAGVRARHPADPGLHQRPDDH